MDEDFGDQWKKLGLDEDFGDQWKELGSVWSNLIDGLLNVLKLPVLASDEWEQLSEESNLQQLQMHLLVKFNRNWDCRKKWKWKDISDHTRTQITEVSRLQELFALELVAMIVWLEQFKDIQYLKLTLENQIILKSHYNSLECSYNKLEESQNKLKEFLCETYSNAGFEPLEQQASFGLSHKQASFGLSHKIVKKEFGRGREELK